MVLSIRKPVCHPIPFSTESAASRFLSAALSIGSPVTGSYTGNYIRGYILQKKKKPSADNHQQMTL